jgi:PAS domain S-box-containing protein
MRDPDSNDKASFLLELYRKGLNLPEKELYEYFLNHAVETTKSAIGFFHLVSDDQESITLTSWNREALKNCTADYNTHYPVGQAGNWADSIRLKRPVIYNDFGKSPNQKGLPEGHVVIKRMLSFPIMEDGKAKAIFGVGNKEDPYVKDDIIQLELVANELNKILKQRKIETELREAKEKYYSLFANMLDGFAYCEMIFDTEGEPVDFVYLEINDAFERLTGLRRENVVGRKVSEAILGTREANPEIFDIYGRVAKTGNPERFELFFKPLSIWLNISVYSPKKGYFAAVFENITERKKTERALRQSETKFRTAANFTYDWEYWIDPSGKLVYVSPSCERITGYGVEEFIKDPKLITKIVYPEDKAVIGSHFDLAQLKELYDVDFKIFRITTRAGEVRWISHACQAVFDDDGEWLGRRVSNRDITEHKQNEEKLRKLNRTLRAISNSNQALMRATDEALFLQEACRIIAEDCGYKMVWVGLAEDDEAKSVRPVAHYGFEKGYLDLLKITWADTEHGRGPTGRAIRTGQPQFCENMQADPSFMPWREEALKRGYASSIALPLKSASQVFGALTMYSAEPNRCSEDEVKLLTELANDFAHGIMMLRLRTEQEKAQAEIRRQQDELVDTLKASQSRQSEISALLEASKAVLIHSDFNKSARAIFDSCKNLLGATAGYVALLSKDAQKNEVLFLDSGGLPCTVDPSLPMPIRGLRAEAYSTGKVVYCNDFSDSEWAKLMPKGHVELKNVLFAPLIIDNKTVGVMSLANKPTPFTDRDIQMASAFGEIASVALMNSQMLDKLEKNEDLLRLNAEHLEELVEERTKQLKDSERLAAIGATAGMVGHDIRNPLQAIMSDVFLLKSDLSAVPEGEEKEGMKESLDGLEKNVEYINKIVQDLQDYAKPLKPAMQETHLDELCEECTLKREIPENIEASCEVAEDAKKLAADPGMLKRILSNLVSNAVQAMPQGGKIFVRAYRDSGDTVITVHDTGMGIPEEVRPRLFTPLFTTKSKGQGFGLAVVKRMTEALGGTVTFESQNNEGTTFIVRLPTSKK